MATFFFFRDGYESSSLWFMNMHSALNALGYPFPYGIFF
jgi:hypothetical protein